MDLDNLQSLTQNLPAELGKNASELVTRMGTVLEGIGDDGIAWRPPAMKVVQAMSDRSKLPKGATIGSILIGENIAPSPVAVIPLRSWDSRAYWDPDQNNAKILCRSPDAKMGAFGQDCYTCPHSKFDEAANKSACSKSKTFLCVTADLSEVFTVDFAKTNFSYGKEFESKIKRSMSAIYKRVYKLQTETGLKAKNVEALTAEPAGLTPTEILEFVEALHVKAGDDRKAMLLSFKEYAESRKGQAAQYLPAPEQAEGTIEVSVLPAATEKEVSSDAKSYKL